ncbi:MAG TPA: hypothetical protein VH877_25890 [Polyangia bacterium]|jgi:hypothetical protein|nr:hypothetical protein [Polyangia bacterium]
MDALIQRAPEDLAARAPAPQRNWPAVLGLAAGMLSIIPCFGLFFGPVAIGLSWLGLHRAPHQGGRRLAVAGLTAAVTLFSLHATMAMMIYWVLGTCPS